MSMKVLTTKQLANLFGVSPMTVQRWCASGKIKASKIGKNWLIPEENVRQLLNSNEPD